MNALPAPAWTPTPHDGLRTGAVALVHTALWALAGFGGGELLDIFRLMSLNQVGAWDSRFDAGIPWMFFVGVFAGSFGGFFLSSRASRFAGTAALFVPWVTGFLGVTIGLALFFPLWTAPQHVGEQEQFLNSDIRIPWNVGAWVWYAAPWWLPAVSFILAGLCALGVLRARRRQSNRGATT